MYSIVALNTFTAVQCTEGCGIWRIKGPEIALSLALKGFIESQLTWRLLGRYWFNDGIVTTCILQFRWWDLQRRNPQFRMELMIRLISFHCLPPRNLTGRNSWICQVLYQFCGLLIYQYRDVPGYSPAALPYICTYSKMMLKWNLFNSATLFMIQNIWDGALRGGCSRQRSF